MTATGTAPAYNGPGRRFVIDVAGGVLDELPRNAPLGASVKAQQGELGPVSLTYSRHLGGWRVAFDPYPKDAPLCEMRANLVLDNRPVTETWTYRWIAS
ncbi:MAG: hypothetical protein HC871_01335 [Rhizobiales bacterium]|nr:hypothetical protein [Hyphomicrobiales bacterium]